MRQPLCVDCERKGQVRPAEEVHHEVPIEEAPEQRYSGENLASLCKECHDKRHAEGALKG